MRVAVKMPTLSGIQTGDGKIVAWLITAGDAVTRGQPLLEVETDKSNVEIEATLSGTLAEIVRPAGSEVPAGEIIAFIESES